MKVIAYYSQLTHSKSHGKLCGHGRTAQNMGVVKYSKIFLYLYTFSNMPIIFYFILNFGYFIRKWRIFLIDRACEIDYSTFTVDEFSKLW